jgi:serine/threonine protein kinase
LSNKTLADRYLIQQEIARGGMGIVYLAHDTKLQRPVAIKRLYKRKHLDEQNLKRFRFEALVTANLLHPNIVQVYEILEFNNIPLYVMEYVEGVALDEYADKSGKSIKEMVKIMIPVCYAIGYAHSKGIIHRDMKPSNILVTQEGAPKIMDFGIAMLMMTKDEMKQQDALTSAESLVENDEDMENKFEHDGYKAFYETTSSTVVGSPCFMAPEQAKGELDKIDSRSDVFSIGATLYKVLTNQNPFQGKTYREMVKQLLHTEPIRPSSIDPSIAPELDDICAKAMAKDPERRYRTTYELADDLQSFLNNRPVSARQYTFMEKAKRAIQLEKKTFAIGTALVWLMFFSVFLVTNWHHNLFEDSLKNEIYTRVMGVANSASLLMDGDVVDSVRTQDDLKRQEVIKLVTELEDLKQRNKDIVYLWIMRKSEKKKGYAEFVLEQDMLYTIDPSEKNLALIDRNKNKKIDDDEVVVEVGEVYEESPRFKNLFEGFKGLTVDDNIHTPDKWGVGLSGYAPVKNSKGEAIAVLGADMLVTDIGKALKKTNFAFTTTIIAFVILSMILNFLFFLWLVGRWQSGK